MLQSKLFEAEIAELHPGAKPQLPVYVQPSADEALLSWVLRLAAALKVSPHALAKRSFGVDDHTGRSQWWRYPDPWLVIRISEKSGVPVDVLRRMTFHGWAPAYREDDDNERFGGRRFDTPAGQHRDLRIAVCRSCIESDSEPFLRPSWMIGWVAVCARHATQLTVRCIHCRSKLKLPSMVSAKPFALRRCKRCGGDIGTGLDSVAHPAAVKLQGALLRGKRDGVTEIEGLGQLTWPATVMLLDVLVGTFWTGTNVAERHRIVDQYELAHGEAELGESSPYHSRYGSLKFITWLTDGWPASTGARVSRTLLKRWLTGKRDRISQHLRPHSAASHNPFRRRQEQEIDERLWDLLASAHTHEQPSVALQPRYSIHD